MQAFSCEFCEIIKNTFCYRAPPVAASEFGILVKFKQKNEKNFGIN